MFNAMAGTNHEFQISGNGVDEDPINVFTIDSHTGEVFVHRAVDREQYEKSFHVSKCVFLIARLTRHRWLAEKTHASLSQQIKFDILDKDTKKKLDRAMAFDIEIMDINDNAPTFKSSQMTIEVNENATGEKPTSSPGVLKKCKKKGYRRAWVFLKRLKRHQQMCLL